MVLFNESLIIFVLTSSNSIGTFSRDVLSFPYDASIDLLMIMNGVGAIGRVVPGFLADLYLGPLNVVTPAAFTCMVLLYCWNAVKNRAALYCWAVLYGMLPPYTDKVLTR